jgi:predicted nucleotidyltransferase component of viral defense system
MSTVLPTVDLPLVPTPYQTRVECGVPILHGLDPYEMIAEKIMACSRRMKGSGKDVYDLDLWAKRPFDDALVRRIAVLKAWIDQRSHSRLRRPRCWPRSRLEAFAGSTSKVSCHATKPTELSSRKGSAQRFGRASQTLCN